MFEIFGYTFQVPSIVTPTRRSRAPTEQVGDGWNLKRSSVYFEHITQCLAVDTISSLWKGEKENLKVKKIRKISHDLLVGRPAGRPGPTDPVKFYRGNRHDTNTPRTSISFFQHVCVSNPRFWLRNCSRTYFRAVGRRHTIWQHFHLNTQNCKILQVRNLTKTTP